MKRAFDIETRETQLNDLLALDPKMMALGHTLGFQVEHVSAGAATVSLECGRHLHNVFDYIHGGVVFAIADTAIGLAYVASIGVEQTGTTVESKINYLRPALSGHLRASAKCLNQGKTLSLYECDVLDDRGRLLARVSATMMTLDAQQSHGRAELYRPDVEHRTTELLARNRN